MTTREAKPAPDSYVWVIVGAVRFHTVPSELELDAKHRVQPPNLQHYVWGNVLDLYVPC